MKHHLDREFATGYQAPKLSARERQIALAQFDNTYRRAYRIGGYRGYVADPDMDPGDMARPDAPQRLDTPAAGDLVTLWNRHVRKG
jgi:hypothetical protein